MKSLLQVRLKDMYKEPNMKFDLVSCQFSFHYCFESFPQAMTMLQNACECLRVGGYFIGTTPDSSEIVYVTFQTSLQHLVFHYSIRIRGSLTEYFRSN